jgi:transposase InsO family protein
MGIRDRPTSPRSPWQNAYVERLIGSIRRDCLDHLIIVDERHLHNLLRDYAEYYNRLRTHSSLNQNAPLGRPVQSHGVLHRPASDKRFDLAARLLVESKPTAHRVWPPPARALAVYERLGVPLVLGVS